MHTAKNKAKSSSGSYLDSMLSAFKGDYRKDKELKQYKDIPFIDANKEMNGKAYLKNKQK